MRNWVSARCTIPGYHGYHAYHCYDRAFLNDVAAYVSMPMGLPCYLGYVAIRVLRFRFVIASHRDFRVFHGTELYCWTHETSFHGHDKLYPSPGSWDRTCEWGQEVFSRLCVFCGYDGVRWEIGLQPGIHWLPDFKGYDLTIREYYCGCLSLDCYVSPSYGGTSSMYHWLRIEVRIQEKWIYWNLSHHIASYAFSCNSCSVNQLSSHWHAVLLVAWSNFRIWGSKLLPSLRQGIPLVRFSVCLLPYVQFWAPDDGRRDRPKHVERFTRINNLRNRCILLVVL